MIPPPDDSGTFLHAGHTLEPTTMNPKPMSATQTMIEAFQITLDEENRGEVPNQPPSPIPIATDGQPTTSDRRLVLWKALTTSSSVIAYGRGASDDEKVPADWWFPQAALRAHSILKKTDSTPPRPITGR
jgi:hypothetical protein